MDAGHEQMQVQFHVMTREAYEIVVQLKYEHNCKGKTIKYGIICPLAFWADIMS